ncbi:uncharacterized protein [Apostichopus japonicus]|uniref:uncharacterized protein n=1 Tax=Stichopus japonicus TaxID=307972 RepID=UPI003AB158F6
MSLKGRFSKAPSLLKWKTRSIDGKGRTWNGHEISSSMPNIAKSSSGDDRNSYPDSSLNGNIKSELETGNGGKTKAYNLRNRFRSLTQKTKSRGKDSIQPKSSQSGNRPSSTENEYEYPGSKSQTKKDGDDEGYEHSVPQNEGPPSNLDNHQFSAAPIGYLNAPKRGVNSDKDTTSGDNEPDYVTEQGISTESNSCYESALELQSTSSGGFSSYPSHKAFDSCDGRGQLPVSNEKRPEDRPPARPPKPFELRGEPINKSNNENEHIPPQPPARQPTSNEGRTFPSIRAVKLLHGNRESGAYESIDEKPSHVVEYGLPGELRKLPQQPWYWGPLTQEQAEAKLRGLPDGYFLVRDSSDERYLLSLSFNSNGRPVHTRFEYIGGLFSINDSQGYMSVVDLIEDAVRESQNGVYSFMQNINGTQTFPARLTCPVSRFTEMKSLQHLCRFVIRETFPRHYVADLPVPEKIRKYILENQY